MQIQNLDILSLSPQNDARTMGGIEVKQSFWRSIMEEKACSKLLGAMGNKTPFYSGGKNTTVSTGHAQAVLPLRAAVSLRLIEYHSGTRILVLPERSHWLQQAVLPLIVNRLTDKPAVVQAAPERKNHIKRYYHWKQRYYRKFLEAYRRLNTTRGSHDTNQRKYCISSTTTSSKWYYREMLRGNRRLSPSGTLALYQNTKAQQLNASN